MRSCGLNGAQMMGSGYLDGVSAAQAAKPGIASKGLPERNFRNCRRADVGSMSYLPLVLHWMPDAAVQDFSYVSRITKTDTMCDKGTWAHRCPPTEPFSD